MAKYTYEVLYCNVGTGHFIIAKFCARQLFT